MLPVKRNKYGAAYEVPFEYGNITIEFYVYKKMVNQARGILFDKRGVRT